MVAEIALLFRRWRGVDPLQWGRDQLVAEILFHTKYGRN